MKGDEEAPADRVVDVPETADHVGYPRREQRPSEAQRTFDARDRSGGRTACAQDHHARGRKDLTSELVKIKRAGISGGGIRGKQETRRGGIISAGGGMAGEVDHLAITNTEQEGSSG